MTRQKENKGGSKRDAVMTMMAICIGDVMNAEQRRKPTPNSTVRFITPLQRPASRLTAGPEEELTRGPEEWQDQMKRLQQWVCELLIKNQELRLALASTMAQEKEKRDD